MTDRIKTWSYTRIEAYESCPYRAKLKFIDKIEEPEQKLPKGKTEHAHDRGTRVHLAAEQYIKGEGELIPELQGSKFVEKFEELRDLYAAGKASVEGEWGFTSNWEPTEWNGDDTWGRVKLDVHVHITDSFARIIDFKTGKKFGNEIKHDQQGSVYSISSFFKYPAVEEQAVEFWYLDQNDITYTPYTKTFSMKRLNVLQKRIDAMLDAREFPPTPSKFSCKWCPYNQVVCLYGVK